MEPSNNIFSSMYSSFNGFLHKSTNNTPNNNQDQEQDILTVAHQSILNSSTIKLNLYSINNILLLQNCVESSYWKKHLVSLANESIEISPNYAGGSQFESMLFTIAENMACKPNLQVHIILSNDFIDNSINNLLRDLESGFPNRFHYLATGKKFQLKPYTGNRENHEKMVIIDGKYVILGGSGIKDEMNTKGDAPPTNQAQSWKDSFVSRGFRDTDVAVEGKVAQDCREHFFELYQSWEGDGKPNRFFPINSQNACSCDLFDHNPKLVKDVKAKMLFTHPLDPRENPISNKIAKLIRKSSKNIVIAHMMFNPTNEISTELLSSKKRGSHITLISNSTAANCPFASRVIVDINRTKYELINKVFEFQIANTLYHKKIMQVDQVHTVIGSYNFSYKSAFLDNEVVIVIKSPKFAAQMSVCLATDIQLSRALSQEEQNSAQSSTSSKMRSKLLEKSTAHFF